MGKAEFIALMAVIGGIVAFSIDAMLPALPDIGAELSPGSANRAQLVISAFVLGTGLGTFVVGPLSDAFGRKPVILGGAALYAAGAALAMFAGSLELLIAARVVQGVGAAAGRIVSMAIIRDLFAGREMARLMSFVTMVFMIVPAAAPLMGSVIIALAGWRGVFASFVIFAALTCVWLALRLPEPLPRDHRRPFAAASFAVAAREVLSFGVVRLSIMVQTLVFAALWASLSSVQQVMGDTYDRTEAFPFWFALIAGISACASLLNARLVLGLGMRRLITLAFDILVLLCLLALAMLGWILPNGSGFAVYFLWQAALFSMVALSLGNLISLAMEPLGHVAGMGASLISGLATVVSAMIAVPVGLAFDGTPLPLIGGVLVILVAARLLMILLNRFPGTEGTEAG